MRNRRARFAVALAAASAFALTACSSGGSGGDTGPIDCDVATASIEAYSTALTDMVIGLSDGDTDAARAAAEDFGPAALDVTRALPGLPPEAEDFVTRSQDASSLVIDSLRGGVEPDVILDELDTLFSDEAFTSAGSAIDEVYNGACGSAAPSQ